MIMILNKILTFGLFFGYSYGFGYLCTRNWKQLSSELHILRLAVGLAAFIILGVFFNLLGTPLHWWIFAGLALFLPIYDLLKLIHKKQICFSLPSFSPKILIAIVLLGFSFYIYCVGPFQYPWLEDEDPWNHAAGIKYVSIERNLTVPPGLFQYINPYPPGYDFLFGILHQTCPSLYWTLKFFNGFIVVLGILFFYFFAKEFQMSDKKALWSLFFLTLMPCYLTHFIWAHSLLMTLFFPAMLCLLKVQKDFKYFWPGILLFAAIFLVQPTTPVNFSIMSFLLIGAYGVVLRRVPFKMAYILIGGLLVSAIWWGPVLLHAQKSSFLIRGFNQQIDFGKADRAVLGVVRELTSPTSGSATRKYHWFDYFYIHHPNYINNPTGVGLFLSVFVLVGLIKSFYMFFSRHSPGKEKFYYLTIILWFIFVFLGMNSATFSLPIGFFAFRFWMLFGVVAALLAGDVIATQLEKYKKKYLLSIAVLSILIIVGITSGRSKFRINMTVWPPGEFWNSKSEILTYVWLRRNCQPNAKVFSFTDNKYVIGHDMFADYWSLEYQENFSNAFLDDSHVLYEKLKANKFEYLIIAERDSIKLGADKISKRVKDFDQNPKFQYLYGLEPGNFVFKIL